MAITEEERMKIIEEYKDGERLKQLERRCKVKPLHDARTHYDKKFEESRLSRKVSWELRMFYRSLNDSIWEAVRSSVCYAFDLRRITDLKAEDYERANNHAIMLIDDMFDNMCP